MPVDGRSTILRRSWMRWAVLALSACLITPAALGVHELMLEGLHVPYPRPSALPVWAVVLKSLTEMLGLIAFARLAAPTLQRLAALWRIVMVASAYLMLHETFRLLIIDITLSNAWVFQSVRAAPGILYALCLGAVVVLTTPRLQRWRGALLIGIAIAVVGPLIVKPALDAAFAPILTSLSALDFPQRYQEPFPPGVLVVIYITFIEAVIGGFAIAALIWPRLSDRPAFRITQFVLLGLLLKGSIGRFVLDPFWIAGPRPAAWLSESQFALETLAMTSLVGLTWTWFSRSRPRSPAAQSTPHPLKVQRPAASRRLF